MGTPYLGRFTTIGIAIEAAWGTPLARTNWKPVMSASLERAIDMRPRPHLGISGAGSANRRDSYVASDFVGGDFEIELCYDDSSVLLVAHAVSSAAIDAGTGPYTHTIENGLALPVGHTIELIRGNGTAEVLEGVLIDEMSIKGAVGEPTTARFTVIGETSAARGAAGAPAGLDGLPVLHHQAGCTTPFAFNAIDYDIKSFEITTRRGLIRRQLYGCKVTGKPVRGGFEEIKFRIVREWDTDAFYTAYLAKTAGDCVIGFTGTGNNALELTGHNAEITSYSSPLTTDGVIDETIEFTCYSDGTDEGIGAVFTNDNALYTAP